MHPFQKGPVDYQANGPLKNTALFYVKLDFTHNGIHSLFHTRPYFMKHVQGYREELRRLKCLELWQILQIIVFPHYS